MILKLERMILGAKNQRILQNSAIIAISNFRLIILPTFTT